MTIKTPQSSKRESNTPLLDSLTTPADLRQLSVTDLENLCSEVRQDLISRLDEVGGHFASSLGVTEITVALHHVFTTPHDRIVWDVGHQAYIHKILTGRRFDINRIRQFGGISGFPRRCESEYDTFGVAHAGTSISAATGMIEASHLDYPGAEPRNVVAVIGDGAMTAGMAFEALNHAGQLHRKLIVILNDNEMSIAPNVGALSLAFSKTVTGKLSTSARRHFKSLVEKGLIPKALYRMLDRAEEAAQGFFSTPAMLFEAFGFRYLGPVDGHNLRQVIDSLERAKAQDGPVLIHMLTVKGKGFEPAEADPVKYHAVGAHTLTPQVQAKAETPSPVKRQTYTDVFGATLVDICRKDSRVVGITAAMPDGTGLSQLAEQMPERFYDVGIAEQHAVTFAAGLSCEGIRPVCAIYSTFLQRAYDQVVHDVCIQSLPVVFVMDRAGLVGADGPTHHGVFDISYLRCLPNMTVMAPKDESELRDMLLTAVAHESGPTAIRYPRGSVIGVDISSAPQLLPIGKAEVVRCTGPNPTVLFLGIGQSVYSVMEAAILLAAEGIHSTVVNMRFVKPLDEALLRELCPKHQLTVTVEDHALMGGFGSAVVEFLSDTQLIQHTKVLRLGIPDSFVEHGTQQELFALCGYDVGTIVERTRELCGTQPTVHSRVVTTVARA
jgi:1-deoxy-D-xylulose-5-phosphate synthase